MRVTLFFVVLIMGAYVLPKYLLSSGLERYGESALIADGYSSANLLIYDNPLGHLIYTKIRVDSVYYQPGTCDRGTTNQYDSVVVLKVHGLFGIPLRGLEAICAGTGMRPVGM